jgi:hypothetical protein
MGTNLRELEEIKNKGFRVLKEHLSPAELVQFLQMLGVGTGDYTKEKYENDENITIEDLERYLAENN